MTSPIFVFRERGVEIGKLQASIASLGATEKEITASLVLHAQQDFSAGRVSDALTTLVNLARLFPLDISILGSLANAFATSGDVSASLTTLRWALAVEPDNQLVATNHAAMLKAAGQDDILGPALERVAVLRGVDAAARSQSGFHFARHGDNERAELAIRRSIASKSNDHARKALIQLLLNTQRSSEAIQAILELESVDPDTFSIFCGLGTELGAFATVERGIRRMLPQVPEQKARADLAMGYVWRYRGDPARSRTYFEAATADPRLSDLVDFELLGLTIRHGTPDEIADAFARRVPWRDVRVTDPRSTLAIDKVRNIHTLDHEDNFNISVDVMFSAFLMELSDIKKGARLFVNKRQVSLFQRSFPELEVRGYPAGTTELRLGAEDLHVRELPYIASKSEPSRKHRARPSLRADPGRLAAARRRHAARAGGRPVVGLCWRSSLLGNTGFRSSPEMLDVNQMEFDDYIVNGRKFWRKCIPLSFFDEIIGDPDLSVVAMQYGLADWEIKRMERHPVYRDLSIDPIDHFGDLDTVVAEIAALDALITIPCGYAHLAGALGVPTYLMLNDVPVIYWAWLRRFPLYPGITYLEKAPEWSEGDMKERKYSGNWSPQVSRAHQLLRETLGPPVHPG